MSYSNQLVNDSLKEIVDLFSKQEVNQTADTLKKVYLEGLGKPIHNWSLGNQLLVYLKGSNDARTFNQWLKVGRTVKKGSKCIYILSPLQKKIEVIDKLTNQKKDQIILNGFKALPVFRFVDTFGAGLKEFVRKDPLPLLEVAEKWNLKIEYDQSLLGEYGSINVKENKITLCTEDQTTFFHELAHKAHSKIETLKAGQDPEQETIAQLASCVLAGIYGHNIKGYTFNYIASYAGSKDPLIVGKLCLRVLSKVQKILMMILEESNETKTELKTSNNLELKQIEVLKND